LPKAPNRPHHPAERGPYLKEVIVLDKLREIDTTNEELLTLGLRKCYKCQAIKGIYEYYADKTKFGGHKYICKSCECEGKKEQRSIDPEKSREYFRKRWEREDIKQRYSEQNRKRRIENPEYFREKSKKQNEHPHSLARKIYRNALTAGKLVKPNACTECGRIGNVDGHHIDYSKPLEVVWLCRICHMKKHRIS
jgi:hypothetical protein